MIKYTPKLRLKTNEFKQSIEVCFS